MSGLRWFVTAVGRRLRRTLRRARTRLSHQLRVGVVGPVTDVPAPPPWSPLSATPGDPSGLSTLVHHRRLARLNPGDRTWAVLTPAPISVGLDDPDRIGQMARLAPDLPVAALRTYGPIAWHTDLRSGHSWDPQQFYLDVRVAPVRNADIKGPWELSRFQHVGALAVSKAGTKAAGIEFLSQVTDWIAANPVQQGVNWACTMDVALRAINWVWGLRLLQDGLEPYPAARRVIVGSLQVHGRHIERNLEYDLEWTTNHYLSNIAGLVYIGAAFPELPESDRWLLFGLKELVSEMERQVYADGAHHEASTNYHRLAGEALVSCAALAERMPQARRRRLMAHGHRRTAGRSGRSIGAPGLDLAGTGPLLPSDFHHRLARMAEFTGALTKPNGLVPQIGDNDSGRIHKVAQRVNEDVRDHRHLLAAVGELLNRDDLISAGASSALEGRLIAGDLRGRIPAPLPHVRLLAPVTAFPDAGIVVVRKGEAHLVVTCGQNGSGGRGGHGHNDKNSFELNVRGRDFIVDGGCPAYTAAPEVRNRYRSTAAHNTVSVDGAEQNKWTTGVSGLFRLSEESAPHLTIEDDGTIVGTHSGFGAPHIRAFTLASDHLVIRDRLADARVRYLNFNLDPDVAVSDLRCIGNEVCCALVHATGALVTLKVFGGGDPEVGPGSFSIGYGVPVENRRLRIRMCHPEVRTELSWQSKRLES